MRQGLKLKWAVRKALCWIGRECSSNLKRKVYVLSSAFAAKYSLTAENFGRRSIPTLLLQAFSERFAEISSLLKMLGYQQLGNDDSVCLNTQDWKSNSLTNSVGLFAQQLLDASIFIELSIDKEVATCNLKIDCFVIDQMGRDLDLMRYIIVDLAGVIVENEMCFCQFCFRRILSRSTCRQHRASESIKDASVAGNKDRNRAKSVMDVIDPVALNLTRRYYAQRKLYGDDVVVSEIHRGTKGFIKVPTDIYCLVIRLNTDHWFDVVGELKSYISKYSPNVFKRIPDQAYYKNSFEAFLAFVYSKDVLDNTEDTSKNPYWFIRTIAVAEFWVIAEGIIGEAKDKRFKDTLSRDKTIIELANSGLTSRAIAGMIGVGKSTVSNILVRHRGAHDE